MDKTYQTRLFYITLFGLAVFLLFPFLYLGQNSCILIFDNLDSDFIYFHLLKNTGLLFSLKPDTIVPNVMNGLPRVLFHSEFSFIRLLFYLFPSFWAYVINSVIIRVIGFIGMYLFAKDYLLKDIDIKITIVFAVLFSIIPLHTIYGLSVMGQPLLIWAFLNLSYNRKAFVNWFIILAFPMYAHFAFVGPFIIIAVALYGFFRLFQKEQINNAYFIALALLCCSFVLFNILTFQNFIFHGNYVSHRTEWSWKVVPIRDAIHESIALFMNGQYHASPFYAAPIYILALIALFYVRNDRKKVLSIISLMALIWGISIFSSTYPTFCYYLKNYLPLLIIFQFRRFTMLVPSILFIALGLSIKYIPDKIRSYIVFAMIAWQSYFIFMDNIELRYNYTKIFSSKYLYPSFNSFFAENLFKDISSFIAKPKSEYRVVSIGIEPSIAQYNGFYTLDSYQNNYPVSYKHEFRKIIAGELAKNKELEEYFDLWGNRCYVYSDELRRSGFMGIAPSKTFKGNGSHIDNLNIDVEQLKKMGAEYIFSAVPISNSESLHLDYLKKFSNKDALWDIYLYKI
jgi:hypothetical protein